MTWQTIQIPDILDQKIGFFSLVFRPPFEYLTIWHLDTNLPFKYQTSPVSKSPLCTVFEYYTQNQSSIHMVFEYQTIQQPDLLHHCNTELVRYSDLLCKICVCYLFDGIFNLLYFGFRRFCKLDEKMKIFSSFFVPNFVANHSLELVRIADHDLRSSKTDDKRFVHVVQTTNNLPPKINIFF